MLWDYGLVEVTAVEEREERFPQEPFFPFLDRLWIRRDYNRNYMTWRTPDWHLNKRADWSFSEEPQMLSEGSSDVSTWHQDGGPSGFDYVAMWATVSPTQFCLPSGERVEAPVGHLVVCNNREVWHRSGRDLTNRHFVRVIPPEEWKPQEEMKWH